MSLKKIIQYIITISIIATISDSSVGFGIHIKLPLLENDHISRITHIQYHTGKGYARFKKGYCTDYVASRRKDLFPLENGLERAFGGSAIERYKNAQKIGVNTGKEPIIGAIAVFKQGQGASTEYGHVALVEKILTGGMIEVSDMNYLGKHIITTRIIPSTKPIGYIYSRKDIESQLKYVPSTLINSTENLGKKGIFLLSFALSGAHTDTTVGEKQDHEKIVGKIIPISPNLNKENNNKYHYKNDIITYTKKRPTLMKYQYIQQQIIDILIEKENIFISQTSIQRQTIHKANNNSPPYI